MDFNDSFHRIPHLYFFLYFFYTFFILFLGFFLHLYTIISLYIFIRLLIILIKLVKKYIKIMTYFNNKVTIYLIMLFDCHLCSYSTSIKCNFDKHLISKKHIHNATQHDIQNNINTLLFICYKCNRKMSSKQSLLYHLHKCNGFSKLQCPICKRFFNSSNSRYKHQLKCNTNNQLLPILSHDTLHAPTYITNNTSINNDNSNNINIIINNFGNENIDYFTNSPEFIAFMLNCIHKKADGICDLIAKKHFDPLHPENHNIRKLNKKDNFLEIFKDNVWNSKDYRSGLDLITIPLETTFFSFVDKMIHDNIDLQKNVFQHFMKEVGSILEWDLSTDKHNFSFYNSNMHHDIDNKSKKMLKTKIYKLFCECIYKYTKIIQK